MATTYTLIDKAILTGTQANVEFTSIPATYTDIKLVLSTRNSSTGNYFDININGSSANLSNRRIYTNSSVVASYSGSDLIAYCDYASRTNSTFDNIEIYIPNYASSNYKSISIDNVTENNGSAADLALIAGLWSSTSAITAIKFLSSTGSFEANSSFYLYGIKNS